MDGTHPFHRMNCSMCWAGTIVPGCPSVSSAEYLSGSPLQHCRITETVEIVRPSLEKNYVIICLMAFPLKESVNFSCHQKAGTALWPGVTRSTPGCLIRKCHVSAVSRCGSRQNWDMQKSLSRGLCEGLICWNSPSGKWGREKLP